MLRNKVSARAASAGSMGTSSGWNLRRDLSALHKIDRFVYWSLNEIRSKFEFRLIWFLKHDSLEDKSCEQF